MLHFLHDHPGEAAVVSVSISIGVPLGGTAAWDVVSVGIGVAVACEVGVCPELCSSSGDFGVVGAPVGLVLVSVELLLVLMEAEGTSGGEVDGGEGDEVGA